MATILPNTEFVPFPEYLLAFATVGVPPPPIVMVIEEPTIMGYPVPVNNPPAPPPPPLELPPAPPPATTKYSTAVTGPFKPVIWPLDKYPPLYLMDIKAPYQVMAS
jgi:hypothetical protein